MGSENGEAGSCAVQAGFRFFSSARTRGIVGSHRVDRALDKPLPEGIVMVRTTDRWHHLREKAVGIVTGQSQIRRRGLDSEAATLTTCGANNFKALSARQMYHVQMSASDFGE